MAERFKQLDGRIEIVTPENIAFQYRVAGPFWRLPAYLIDVAIQFGLISIVSLGGLFAFGSISMPGIGWGVALITTFFVSWFYGGLFEAMWNGQTPGKRMLGLRVVTSDGQPINALQAILRNLLRAVDGLPTLGFVPTFQVGLLTCLSNSRFARLGDLACGTMVIIEDRQQLRDVTRVREPAVEAIAASLPADLRVSRSLARALAKYVDRRHYFPPARRAEVAGHLGRVLLERYELPPVGNYDLLLCALYNRAFIADLSADELLEESAAPAPLGAVPLAVGARETVP